ncbi:O-acetyl-ADP-ribose deacetylase [Desulforhopalus singaporensis]|uniref:O-acetyl-ADP-ribose deacetylase (Regulator of RNase III), contains Macro domain n=1 Tax=Desulforhopalus singaporensis TaxID=91360 RepID=A0A1H0URD8_9BACT|nr:O-acetyl-ADP-ribose deacetylase [Desulforhopalus singaporensis]SDP68819.1 O-acetyl-ADP-ribose deacetylase (regulator of RNase III), contains Macro domain [Desulforhopalus singaporensis]
MERIQIVSTDITRLKVDAIVNAANSTLLGGGGVDGAIHSAAGPELLEECRQLHGCPTGEAKITGGYNLPAKFVIHTVGPIWQGGGKNERSLLASCYRKSLECGAKNGVKTIAFPAISCGAYGFPVATACDIAMDEVIRFLENNDAITTVFFSCFSPVVEKELIRAKNEREAAS